ncbi:hypothetical protein [Gilliamella sp. ESL0250]|uniref:hypothetical protein n=1 Tax=Gilliamella sp. ESL0250 TaxID=2705036 RepID=UPI0015809454|nr:hypothetical protein [Gilliamella sp. ESL0250]NUF49775.1 hypothetical protein [Gilliamella sp. ESL0250]
MASLRLTLRLFNASECHENNNNNTANANGIFRDSFDNNFRDNFEDINEARVKIRLMRLFDKFKT